LLFLSVTHRSENGWCRKISKILLWISNPCHHQAITLVSLVIKCTAVLYQKHSHCTIHTKAFCCDCVKEILVHKSVNVRRILHTLVIWISVANVNMKVQYYLRIKVHN
jgi:hypothetical protein